MKKIHEVEKKIQCQKIKNIYRLHGTCSTTSHQFLKNFFKFDIFFVFFFFLNIMFKLTEPSSTQDPKKQEIEIPDFAEEAVFLQNTILQLNEQNYEEIASILYMNFSDAKDEDMDKIASNVFTVARVRPKLQKQFAKLMSLFSLLVGKQYDIDTLLSAPPWLLRHLYLEGLVDLVKVKERIKERPYYLRYFVPELGYNESTFTNQFSMFHAKVENLKKDDWALYKEILEFGYMKDSLEYIIKFDDVEALKKKEIKRDSSVSISPIECINFNENQYPRPTPSQYDSQTSNVPLLAFAAHYGSEKCFDHLKTIQSLNALTAVHACFGGNINIVKKCIQQISNVANGAIAAILTLHNDVIDILQGKIYSTPSKLWAPQCGNVMAVLKDIQNVNSDDDDSITRLMAAAEYGHYGCVDILYHKGFDYRRSNNGSALDRAATCGHIAVVRLLLKYDPNPMNNSRSFEYVNSKNQTAIIKLLKNAGLSIPQSSNTRPYRP